MKNGAAFGGWPALVSHLHIPTTEESTNLKDPFVWNGDVPGDEPPLQGDQSAKITVPVPTVTAQNRASYCVFDTKKHIDWSL
jgi:hypothetical protein